MNIKSLKPLVMMQLKNKLDLSFVGNTKKTISKIVLSIFMFIVINVFAVLLFFIAQFLNIFSLTKQIPVSVVVLIFTFLFLLSLLSTTYGLMKSLYYAKDNALLLTLPVTHNSIFLSKLIVFYIFELKRTLTFIFPLFLGYGIINGLSVSYFLWLPVAFLFVSMLPVVLGAFLSIIFMVIAQLLKTLKYFKFVLYAAIFGGLFYLVIYLISLIPSNLNIIGAWGVMFWRIQDFLKAFMQNAFVFSDITAMITGQFINFEHYLFTSKTLITFGIVIAINITVLLASFVIVKPLFFKMASKSFEYKKDNVKIKKKNLKRPTFWALIRKEFIINFRSSDDIFSTLSSFAALPVLIFLLNKIFAAIDTRLFGDNLAVSFTILLTLMILLFSNVNMASVYSREGASSYLIKTRPVSYHISLTSKLAFNFTFNLISLIITAVMLKIASGLSGVYIAFYFFLILFVYISHLLWSAELDIMKPQYEQYSTVGSNVNNPNENKSGLIATLLAFMFFAVGLFFFTEGILWAWIKLIAIALCIMIFRIYLFYNKIKVYYKEIV